MLKLLLLVCVSLSSALADSVQCSSSTGGTFRFSVSSRRNQTGGWMVLVDSDRAASSVRPTALTVDVEQETRSCEDGEHIHLVTVATIDQSTVTSSGITEVVEPVPASPTPVKSAASACREYSKVVDSKQCFIDQGKPFNGRLMAQAEHKEFPHMAIVGYGEKEDVKWTCDGVLISPSYVLTTALCANISSLEIPRWMKIGDSNTEETEPVRPQEVAIAETILHPDFKPPSFSYNIALLRLEKDVELNEFARPACLHTAGDVDGRTGIVAVWTLRGNLSRVSLMKMQRTIRTTNICTAKLRSWRTRDLPSGSVVFVGVESEDRFGGILHLISGDADCMYDIVGLLSFKRTCDTGESLIAYTRVSYFVPWIEKIAWGTGSP